MLRFLSSFLILFVLIGCSKKDDLIYTPSEKKDPYKINDNRNPLNIYGKSKYNAELIIEGTLNIKNHQA